MPFRNLTIPRPACFHLKCTDVCQTAQGVRLLRSFQIAISYIQNSATQASISINLNMVQDIASRLNKTRAYLWTCCCTFQALHPHH